MTHIWGEDQLDKLDLSLPPDPMSSRVRSRAFTVLMVGALLWLTFSALVMPKLIHDGYEGNGLALLNRVMEHRAHHAVGFYLAKWYKLAGAVLAAWLGVGLLFIATSSRAFAERIVGVATPGTLGAIRVFICLICGYAAFDETIKSAVLLPDSERKSMGVMNFIYAHVPGFSRLVHNPTGLDIYKALTIGVLLIAALGWKTRPFLALGALLYLPLMGIQRSFTWFNHCGIIPFYVLMVLIVTRSGDGWSLDRLIKIWRNQPVPPAGERKAHYGWARYAVWVVICLPYVAAGFSKLRNGGPWWWTGVNLQQILYMDALRPGSRDHDLILELHWLPPFAFTLMGIMTILTEAGMGLCLVSAWARRILPVMTALMHVGIELFQKILFWDLILLQAVFYDWSVARRWIARKLARRSGKMDVLYDGHCPLCRRSVRMLGALDLFERLNYVDFRHLDVMRYNDDHGTSLTTSQLDSAMHVVHRGRAHRGYDAVRKLSLALPALWPAAPFIAAMGLGGIGARLYGCVARNRMALLQCSSHTACAPEPTTPRVAPTLEVGPRGWRTFLRPIATTGLISMLVSCWALRVEFYPLTAMQMFSSYNGDEVLTYYRVYQTDAAGNVREAYLDQMALGVSRYRPIMQNGFSDARGRQRCIELLKLCGETWNKKVKPADRVVKLDVQKRLWNFVQDRHDPEHGQAVDHIIVSFDADGAVADVHSPAPRG